MEGMSSSAPAEDIQDPQPPSQTERPEYVPYKIWPVDE